jgi:hypothetical protein
MQNFQGYLGNSYRDLQVLYNFARCLVLPTSILYIVSLSLIDLVYHLLLE